jgi:hypothetical protein
MERHAAPAFSFSRQGCATGDRTQGAGRNNPLPMCPARYKPLPMCSERTQVSLVPAEGLLGAARLAPSGSPFGRSTSLRDVVEPGMFYVGGSNLQRRAINADKRDLDGFENWFAG